MDKSQIKHIWWDFDGTLYKMPAEFEQLKYDKRFATYGEIIGEPVTEKLKTDYQELYQKHGSHSAVFMSLGKDKDFWAQKHEDIDLLPYLKPDFKTAEMFRHFAQLPYRHSIFTNRKKSSLKDILNFLDIDFGLFTNIVSSEDLARPKPDPEGYQKAVELSGLAPTQLLYVGDRISADIKPAKAAGFNTALVWSEATCPEADYTFPHVGDVITLFT